jgi:predicted GNAT superfamily acetyltransferase
MADSALMEDSNVRMTTRNGREVVLRPCESIAELDACVQLQAEAWGYESADLIPRRAFVVARHIGGQVIGAFPAGETRLVGFAMALPGVKPGGQTPYLHSHMLAVDPEWRDQGIGRQLKQYQRLEALARGLNRMEWTFDPLEGKNAFLNIHKLGVIVRRYLSNFYGVSSSRPEKSLPTDRLLAEWYLDSDRVQAVLRGEPRPVFPIEETIMIPAELSVWKAAGDLHPIQEAQQTLRLRFEEAFAGGLAVVNFRKDAGGNGNYELAVWPD